MLVDGVKVLHDNGWVLALPDPEEAITHVYAEGSSDADARRLDACVFVAVAVRQFHLIHDDADPAVAKGAVGG